MVRKDGAEARKERITKILSQIMSLIYSAKQENLHYISLKKTKAILQLDTGLTKEKIDDYLALLQEAGKIELDLEKDQIRYPVL